MKFSDSCRNCDSVNYVDCRRQSSWREELGVDGWVNATSDFKAKVSSSLPISYQQMFYVCILGHVAVQTDLHFFIRSYTDGVGCHARCRPANPEQFGAQYLAQGHFDMQTRGTNQVQTTNVILLVGALLLCIFEWTWRKTYLVINL